MQSLNAHGISSKSFLAICILLGTVAIGFAQEGLSDMNRKIAFASDRDGDLEIYTMNSDGTEHHRLTVNPGIDSYPIWSPDGRRIAYLSQVGPGSYAIRLMDDTGTNKTTLTRIMFTPGSPFYTLWAMSWSPDGRKIAFQENGEIFTIDIETGDRVNLTNYPAANRMPVWSPDGTKIAFVSNREAGYCSRLHTMNADGSNVQSLPCSPWAWGDFFPDWSPNGDELTYVAWSEEILPIIYVIKPDGTDRRIFDTWGCPGWSCNQWRSYPRWSPDGRKIAFSMSNYTYSNGDTEIFVKDIGGSTLTQLSNTPGNNLHPAWQPLVPQLPANGKIAFYLHDTVNGQAEIWVMNADGSGQTNITNSLNMHELAPSWSPDGKKVAFLRLVDFGDYFLMVMDADGSNKRFITSIFLPNENEFGPSWSPDGKKITFASQGDIFSINVDGTNRVNLTNNPAFEQEPSWSPDGSKIAFSRQEASNFRVYTMNPDGTKVERTDIGSAYSGGYRSKWSPDGRHFLYYSDLWGDCNCLITSRIDGSDNTIISYNSRDSDWSPDGTKIVFSQYMGGIYVASSGRGGRPMRIGPDRAKQPDWQPLPRSLIHYADGN